MKGEQPTAFPWWFLPLWITASLFTVVSLFFREYSTDLTQHPSQESHKNIKRVEAGGLPRYHLLDAPDEAPLRHIGLRVELEDKRALRRQERFLRARGDFGSNPLFFIPHTLFFYS